LKNITLVNLILILSLVFISSLFLSSFSEKKELKSEIYHLKKELEDEKKTSVIYEKTKIFLEKLSSADHGDMLTGIAKETFEEAKKEHSKDLDHHGVSALDHIEVRNIFIAKMKDDNYKAFAIYRVYYNKNLQASDIKTQRIFDLTLIADWKKSKSTYKVFDYKMDILRDSLDQHLKEMANQKEGE
jgi:hypothetical protein